MKTQMRKPAPGKASYSDEYKQLKWTPLVASPRTRN